MIFLSHKIKNALLVDTICGNLNGILDDWLLTRLKLASLIRKSLNFKRLMGDSRNPIRLRLVLSIKTDGCSSRYGPLFYL